MTQLRTSTRGLVGLLIGLLVLVSPLNAAAPGGILSSTTLSAAITISQTTLVLSSASASTGSTMGAPAVGHCLYVDTELMRITALSSTTATVTRATRGAAPHAASAIIVTGPCAAGGLFGGFRQTDPVFIVGNQDCTTWINPWINTNTGDSWWCDASSNVVSVTNVVARNGTAGSRRVAQ